MCLCMSIVCCTRLAQNSSAGAITSVMAVAGVLVCVCTNQPGADQACMVSAELDPYLTRIRKWADGTSIPSCLFPFAPPTTSCTVREWSRLMD